MWRRSDVRKLRQLLGVGQLAVDQQVAGLDEIAPLGEHFDRVAAIAQNALVAVEEGDGAGRRAGVDVALVEGDVAGLARSLEISIACSFSVPTTTGSSTSWSPIRSLATSLIEAFLSPPVLFDCAGLSFRNLLCGLGSSQAADFRGRTRVSLPIAHHLSLSAYLTPHNCPACGAARAEAFDERPAVSGGRSRDGRWPSEWAEASQQLPRRASRAAGYRRLIFLEDRVHRRVLAELGQVFVHVALVVFVPSAVS